MHASGTRRTLLLPALALLGLASGCAGYRTDPIFPAGAKRVAVPVFDNLTYFRQIELDLTRNVCDELRSRPGIEIVDEAHADVILKGTISGLSQSVLKISERRRPDEESATTSVTCELVEARTGRPLKNFSVSERVDFVLLTGEGLQTAQREAYYNLARKIVFELESDW
jgi:hypothetical protein